MHQISVGNISIDVVRKDIKNMHLGVYPPSGRIRIAAPLKIDDKAVRLFAISKMAWIQKQQLKFETQERQSERRFVSGESHYYKGERFLLNVIYHNAAPKVEIRNKIYIDLYVRVGSTLKQREKVLIEWYRRQLKDQIPALIDKWQKIIGVEVSDWGIKKMKTRWGTCTIADRRIWLNLELAKKPEHCLEYIIVHEMVHLMERNHNERFVAYMDEFIPQWHFYKDELNRSMLSHEKWNY
jgi:predicted metal-dependent hydrolase